MLSALSSARDFSLPCCSRSLWLILFQPRILLHPHQFFVMSQGGSSKLCLKNGLRTFESIKIKKEKTFPIHMRKLFNKARGSRLSWCFSMVNFKFRVACLAGGIIFVRVRVLEALPREASPPHSANGFAVPLLKTSSRERSRRLRRLNFVHSCY